MSDNLNWAVLGTGVIANEMAVALQKMGKTLYAVANRTHEKAVVFAKKYGVEKVYDDIDDMFVDEKVDIIYITTPHNTHYQFMKRALENGKHILVEKSITLNSRELNEMIDLASQKQLIIAEAMTIWHMPLYKELWGIVERGELGKVQMITMNFGSFKEYNMQNRFFNMNLAGGAQLDGRRNRRDGEDLRREQRRHRGCFQAGRQCKLHTHLCQCDAHRRDAFAV